MSTDRAIVLVGQCSCYEQGIVRSLWSWSINTAITPTTVMAIASLHLRLHTKKSRRAYPAQSKSSNPKINCPFLSCYPSIAQCATNTTSTTSAATTTHRTTTKNAPSTAPTPFGSTQPVFPSALPPRSTVSVRSAKPGIQPSEDSASSPTTLAQLGVQTVSTSQVM